MLDYAALITLFALWLLYGLLHSLLATQASKQTLMPALRLSARAYRLLYNGLALLLLLPLLAYTRMIDGPVLWQWPAHLQALQQSLHWGAIVIFAWTCLYYDMFAFLGLRQESTQSLQFSPLHRWVRHPWYLCALIYLWSSVSINTAELVSYGVISIYFFVGAHLEEKRLAENRPDVYQTYLQQTTAIIPLPWKYVEKTFWKTLGKQT